VRPVPADDPAAAATEGDAATLAVGLDEVETRALLETVPSAYRTRIEEVLLAALALAVARWAGPGALAVDVEGHGREPLDPEHRASPESGGSPGSPDSPDSPGSPDAIDLSRTVGWFTSLHPVVLEVAATAPPGEALVAIKEQLRRVPRRGLAFGIARELGDGALAARLRALPAPQIAFNYLGQWDAVLGAGAQFALASESPGAERDPRGALAYELEIDAAVYAGRLEAVWRYGANRHRRETVAALAGHWRAALGELIAHCTAPGAGGYSTSDFPDVSLAPEELDALLQRMD
jgi:non-ribosomal peptide synthase protein (TIGR01720 family)